MSNPPARIADYFGVVADQAVITGQFRAGDGWTPVLGAADYDTLRMLRRQGYTAVAVTAAGRTADFTIAEVLAYAARPVFGGRVI